MRLPNASSVYNAQNEQQTRSALEREDQRNLKRDQDIELVENRIILISPNGTKYAVVVSNTGTLSTVAV